MSSRVSREQFYPAPLLAVAAFGLARGLRSFPSRPLPDDEWATLVTEAVRHRLPGLLRAAVDEGALPATDRQVRQARAAHLAAATRVLALEQGLLDVVDVLTSAGVATRVLKGSAVARLDWCRPELRSFVDLDVLVRPDDIASAVRALGAAGLRRTLAEPRPGFDRRFDKGMTLTGPVGYELDLHRTFVLGPWGVRVDLDDLWADPGVRFSVMDRHLRALGGPHRFVHACYHAALGDWPLRLGSLRDLAEVMRRADDEWAEWINVATRWRIPAVVAAAITDSRSLLGIADDDELGRWAREYEPSRREASHLALHTRQDKTFAAQALATLRVLPRFRDKAAYAYALLLPRVHYTADRHSSRWTRLAYGVTEARRGSARTGSARKSRSDR